MLATQTEITVNGLRSPLLTAGPADDREAVLYLHGNPGSGQDWADLVGRTGEFTRTLAPDLPGFGKADKPDDLPYTVEGFVGQIDAMLRQLGVQRVHLVTHDFGGPFGLLWAVMNPDRFASAVLINTGVLPNYRWHILARIWRTPWLGEMFQATATRPTFKLMLKRGNPRGLPGPFVDRMYDDFDKRTRAAVLKLYRATDDPGPRSDFLIQALKPHDRPALVIWGKADPYIGVGYAERQKEAFPRAQVQVLPDSGHWPMADNPEAVAELVVPFLREQIG